MQQSKTRTDLFLVPEVEEGDQYWRAAQDRGAPGNSRIGLL